MAGGGRIEGRVSGENYELVQGGEVRQTIPLSQVRGDLKFLAAIKRNAWEQIPDVD